MKTLECFNGGGASGNASGNPSGRLVEMKDWRGENAKGAKSAIVSYETRGRGKIAALPVRGQTSGKTFGKIFPNGETRTNGMSEVNSTNETNRMNRTNEATDSLPARGRRYLRDAMLARDALLAHYETRTFVFYASAREVEATESAETTEHTEHTEHPEHTERAGCFYAAFCAV